MRKAWREGKRIRKKTLANLTHLPHELVEGIRRVLKGGVVVTSPHDAFVVQRSLPHGHVAAVLGLCRQLGVPRLLHRTGGRARELALAALIARVLSPASKLATARQLSPDTAAFSLGAVLGLGTVTGNEVLNMLDWLLKRQPWIERSLARRYLKDATLVLYDMTSSYLEGRGCPLARFGQNRDGIYIVRTSLDARALDAHRAVTAYKSLARVERAFRNLKTARLQIRPVYVYSAEHVRAHVFLCTLACHVEWHLRRRLAPLLFEDDDPQGARAQRASPVQPARTSERARRKSATKTTAEGLPVHSLSTLLDDLATLSLNTVHLPDNPDSRFAVATQPTPLQRRAFKLLNVDPGKMFPVRVQVE